MLLVLAENGIKTLDNLADLASDELLEFIPDGKLSEESANEIILNAYTVSTASNESNINVPLAMSR